MSLSDNLTQPNGVEVNPATGEIWVADYSRQQLQRYPNYNELSSNPEPQIYVISAARPIGITLDKHGVLYTPDIYNRIQMRHPSVTALLNLADNNPRIAPGMWTAMYIDPEAFGVDEKVEAGFPLPFELADLQVLVDRAPAPLLAIEPGINDLTYVSLVTPNLMSPSGIRELILLEPSTQRIIASSLFEATGTSPAFLTLNNMGTGQIAAVNNATGTVNSSANPAHVGDYVQLYLTGAGAIPGAPADGVPAPADRLIYTPGQLRVFFGPSELDRPGEVQFSGLAPGLVSLWQVNIKVPERAIPGPNSVVLTYNSAPVGTGLHTTIAVER